MSPRFTCPDLTAFAVTPDDACPPVLPVDRAEWGNLRASVSRPSNCARSGSFTEVSDQVLARSRLTTRLRAKVSAAVTATNRAMSEVAADYGVAWWTVHRILVTAAVQALGQTAPTMISIDETRARAVRWFFKETGWARSDPWMTSIVDLDPTHASGIIGLRRTWP